MTAEMTMRSGEYTHVRTIARDISFGRRAQDTYPWIEAVVGTGVAGLFAFYALLFVTQGAPLIYIATVAGISALAGGVAYGGVRGVGRQIRA